MSKGMSGSCGDGGEFDEGRKIIFSGAFIETFQKRFHQICMGKFIAVRNH